MAANADAILATLRSKESSGNYAEKPPPGSTASGAYGFLDSTWANYGGYAHAWQAPPAVQDERARKDVEGLLSRFNGDATSVFKAWYAGAKFASKDQDAPIVVGGRKYPSTNEYAAAANKLMGGGGTTATGQVATVTTQALTSGTQKTPIPGIDPKLPIEDQITALAYSQHGDVLAPFIHDPEIRAILRRYVNGEIDDDTMVGLVQQTNVFRTTDLSRRKWQDLKASDPATAAKSLEQSKFSIARTAETLGYQMKPEDVAYLAERVIYDGLSTDQVRSLIVGHFAMTGGGDAGAAYSTVNNVLGNWMVNVDDATKQQWATDILMGRLDENTLVAHLRNVNATQFPGMATALQQNPNLTPQQYVAPIRSTISQLLGVNSQDVDFTDPKWKALVNHYDPQAKTYRALTDPEIQQTIRSDETYGWRFSKNAEDTYSGFALNLAKALGRRPS